MSALMRDAEVVLVRDEGLPSGILTRADALAILRTALGRGVGKRAPPADGHPRRRRARAPARRR